MPTLKPIWRLSHWAYRQSSPLLIMDNGKYVDTILSEEGVKQGDTLGSLLFALSMQRLYRRCTEGIFLE